MQQDIQIIIAPERIHRFRAGTPADRQEKSLATPPLKEKIGSKTYPALHQLVAAGGDGVEYPGAGLEKLLLGHNVQFT